MLPPIPEKLWKIDESTIGEHFSLIGGDRCYYIWEYAAGERYDFSPTNQFIRNLKIKPTWIRDTPARNHYKLQAIAHAARALSELIPRPLVDTRATFVPMPCSKVVGHPDHDPRLLEVVTRAFGRGNSDIRELLIQSTSTVADHESADRQAYDDLRAITQVRADLVENLRPVVILVDDVLNSGKHFRVAQSLVREHCPDAEIRGVFLARCIRAPFGFENLDD